MMIPRPVIKLPGDTQTVVRPYAHCRAWRCLICKCFEVGSALTGKRADAKKALLASGTLNPHSQAVQSKLFTLDFFDPHDRAQVKYEMLRAQRVEGVTVAEASRR